MGLLFHTAGIVLDRYEDLLNLNLAELPIVLHLLSYHINVRNRSNCYRFTA